MDPRHLWLDASGRGVTGEAGGVLCVPCHDTNRYEIKHSHTDLAQASVAPPVSTRARVGLMAQTGLPATTLIEFFSLSTRFLAACIVAFATSLLIYAA